MSHYSRVDELEFEQGNCVCELSVLIRKICSNHIFALAKCKNSLNSLVYSLVESLYSLRISSKGFFAWTSVDLLHWLFKTNEKVLLSKIHKSRSSCLNSKAFDFHQTSLRMSGLFINQSDYSFWKPPLLKCSIGSRLLDKHLMDSLFAQNDESHWEW